MIETGLNQRVKIQNILTNQLPEYLRTENPKAIDFLKQYYLGQENQGSPIDLIDGLVEYLKLDTYTSSIVNGTSELTSDVSSSDTTINVSNTKGYVKKSGIVKINSEIIFYQEANETSLVGCVRGFSGIENYDNGEAIFKSTSAASHSNGDSVTNLSNLFLKEYFNNLKVLYAPGFENESFDDDLDINNFVKHLRTFYNAKGTEGSFNILTSALFGKPSKLKNQADFLFEPSTANYRNRLFITVEAISGDPLTLSGQTLFQDQNPTNSEITGASAPISEVEFASVSAENQLYNLFLFSRFSDPAPGFDGKFAITPSTKTTESVSANSNVLSVDTTIGFAKTGVIVVGNQTITYTDKTINQFLGCSGINNSILVNQIVRTNDIAYATNPNTGERVELRVTGVISEFLPDSDIFYGDLGEVYQIKHVGQKINNPNKNKSNLEIIANTWRYNTSARIRIDSFSGSTFTLETNIDKAYLRDGDTVEILNRANSAVVVGEATVTVSGLNQVILSGTGVASLVGGIGYDIRRKIKKSVSIGNTIDFGNNTIVSDVLNTYVDKNNTNIFVASNSLPSYDIEVDVVKSTVDQATAVSGALQDFDAIEQKYNILSFPSSVNFITGDAVVYSPGTSTDPIDGLIYGRTYYIEVLSPNNKVKLYGARSFILTGENIKINEPVDGNTGSHDFILAEQYNKKISPQKVFRRIPVERSLDVGQNVPTTPGPIGILVNGVEIVSYKTDDKIFYGPLKNIRVLNGGKEYSVTDPPIVDIGDPDSGETAKAYASVEGTLKSIYIDPQEFGIDSVAGINVKGGNGVGALVEPIVEDVFREINFNASSTNIGGGVDPFNDTITTLREHALGDGDAVVYTPNGNKSPGIVGFGKTNITGRFLETGTVYFAEVVTSTSLRLYENLQDYNAGINTVGFSTGSEAGGQQTLRLLNPTKSITGVNVLDGGSGYANRKVAISTLGVSTFTNTLTFEGHGYSTGELITYEYDGDPIVGIATTVQFVVTKIDDNDFRITKAGVGGTDLTRFERGFIENFSGVGTGFHIFNYPKIEVEVNVTIANTVGVITATPVVTGPITDILLYDKGGPYGTTILNFEKTPTTDILNGKEAEFSAVIVDGEIRDVNVTNQGKEYFSLPIVEAESPTGTGAILRPVIDGNGKVTGIIVIRKGEGYQSSSTNIKVTPQGSGALTRTFVRDLAINQRFKFKLDDSEVLFNRGEESGFQYAISGINSSTIVEFNDIDSNTHSPLIGWAYDGNPIYGAKGFEDPNDAGSTVISLTPGYVLDTSDFTQRPGGFPLGFFTEDYKFTDVGDLDIHNGRFTKTPEYPNGVYAYFAVNEFDGATGELVSKFPYVIGDLYKSSPIEENLIGSQQSLTQDFDFNNSELLRNTFPYLVSEEGGGYDFYFEPYEFTSQRVLVNNIKTGGVTGIEVLNPGQDYQVGDKIVFDNEVSRGSGAAAEVEEIFGPEIDSISNESIGYSTFVFSKSAPGQIRATIGTYHDLNNGTVVKISGLSTYFPQITGFKRIEVIEETFGIQENMPAEPVGGMKTDIKISPIPSYVRPDTEITIEGETLKVLNVFGPSNNYSLYNSVLRATRGISTDGHQAGIAVTVKSSDFYINATVDQLNSFPNDKIYFNPNEVVGFGTTSGGHVGVTYEVLGITSSRSIPIQSIYLEDHPFKTNQKVKFGIPSGSNPLSIRYVAAGSTLSFPEDGVSQEVFIVNKGKNTIGIKTTINSDIIIFNADGDQKVTDSENYDCFIETIPDKNQVTGQVDRLSARVSTASTHQLQIEDRLKLDIATNLTRGVGSASSIRVSFDPDIRRILFDPIGFGSESVNAETSEITIIDHGLETGDKLYYKGPNNPSTSENPINNTEYFAFVVDKDRIQLGETYLDVVNNNPKTVGLATTGGSGQSLSIINPEIKVTRNNNLKFNVSDTSLDGYELQFFFDQDFRNELVGTGKSTSFEISGVGTIGAGVGNESITIEYNENLPEQIYYNLREVSTNTLIEPDEYITNHSRIIYVASKYKIDTTVVGIASTSFLVAIFETPERNEYTNDECDVLRYSTRSETGLGKIKSLKIINSGSDYQTNPTISTVTSTAGINADLTVISTKIGEPNSFVIEKPGFELSQDKTLQPVADIPTYYSLENFNRILDIDVRFGGQSFVGVPQLTVVNSVTNEVIEDAELLPILTESGGSIDTVEIIKSPSGLAGVAHSIYTTDNSNGLTIIEADSVNTGIITVKIVTPVLGFATNPLSAGDDVFVDGIDLYVDPQGNTYGDGFNSKNYDFKFFKVQNFNGGTNPAQVTFDLTGLSTNPGIARTSVNFGSIVKKENYPLFKVNLTPDQFINNERLMLVDPVSNIETDLFVTKSTSNGILKTLGDFKLNVGDVVLGKISGTKAKIREIQRFNGFYKVDSGVEQNFGWSNFRGFFNNDTQVLQDNDYYQKLAYSVKTEVEWEDLVDSMNRMVHISGTKNFVDTTIQNNVEVGIGQTEQANSTIVVDIIEDLPVSAQRSFDFAVDTDVITNSPKATNSIKFGTKKLTTFIECKTNRVLVIDDISQDFSDTENLENKFADFLIYPASVGFNRFFILITSREDRTHYEIIELIVSNDELGNTFSVERMRIKSDGSIPNLDEEEIESLGEIEAIRNDTDGSIAIRFTPTNELKAYDIKAFRSLFDSRTDGTGNRILQDNLIVGNADTVSAGLVTSIVSFGLTAFNGSYSTVEILDQSTGQKQFAEISLLHDGISETFIGEYGFDSDKKKLSFQPIGTFGSSIFTDTDGVDKFSLDFTSASTGNVVIKSRNVGFGTGVAGIGSISFKLGTQENMTERTARLESDTFDTVLTGAGVSIVGLSSLSDRVSRSIVRIGVGETQVMTNVVFAQDPGLVESQTLEYPQIGVNTVTGIGTFTGTYKGKYAYLQFIPDSAYVGATARIEQYSEILYSDQDSNSILIEDFSAGTILERVVQGIYQPADQLEFELLHEGFPIYAHRFDPGNPSIFRLSDGRITIPSHFLQSGQELNYKSGTTIAGLSSSKIGIGTTLSGGGSFNGDVRAGDKVISGVTTTEDIVVGQEIQGQGVSAAATVISIGTTSIFFNGNSFGTTEINGIGNYTLLKLGDTVTDLDTNTGFGTITAIGINSIVVDNNVPVGVGSTYFIDRVGLAVSMSLVSTATTSQQTYRTGVTTDVIPDTLFAIRVDNDNIKLATKKDFALSGIGLEITDRGLGNHHLLDTTKKLTKTIITIDGIVQNPISRTGIEYNLQEDIGVGRSFFALSGIATINAQDVLKIGDEFMQVIAVGFGTSAFGPVSGVGTFNVAQVERGYVGTNAEEHADGDLAIVHKGAFNIAENSIFFTAAPTGAGAGFVVDDRNLPVTRSSFSGRTYLRQDYALNEIYDDISPGFTGLGKTFDVTVAGSQPAGIETAASGSGVVFINGIHQGQTSQNNPSNVYSIEVEDVTNKVQYEFSGNKLISGEFFISQTDPVVNELPTGGRIISLGFTGGSGIAPLVPAKVIAEVGAGGTITDIIGVNTTGVEITVSTVDYTHQTGIATITTSTDHNLEAGYFAEFANLEFECTSGYDALVGINTLVYDNVSGVMTVTTSSAHNLAQDQEIKFNDLNFRCEKGFDSAIGISTYEYNNVSGILTVTTSSVHNLNRNMTIRLENLSFACSSEHAGVTTTIFPENQDGTVFNTVLQVNSTTEFEVQVGTSTIGHIPDGAANSASVETGITTTVFPSDLGIGFAISAGEYTSSTGVATFTTRKSHNIDVGSSVILADILVSLPGAPGTIFPNPNNPIRTFEVDAVPAANQFEVYIGSIGNYSYIDHGIVRAVKFANPYRVSQINSTTEFETNVRTVGFAHTYIGGGNVETGFTTTKFPDERGIIYNISNFEYDKTTGLSTITTNVDHNIAKFDQVNLSNIEFTCAAPHAGVTTTIFPDGTQGTKYFVIDVPADNQLTVNVGISTIDHVYDTGGQVYGVKNTGPYSVDTVISNTKFSVDFGIVGFAHTYVGGGTVARYFDGLNFGQGYFNTASAVIEEDGHEGTDAVISVSIPDNEHTFVSAATDSVTGTGGPYTPTDATYNVRSGDLVLTIAGHTLTTSDTIGIATESLSFTCLQDGNNKIKTYPREVGGSGVSDPAYNTSLAISATTTNTITVNVGEAKGGKYTGGRLKFDITNPGTGYTSPTLNVSTPSYGNLDIQGIFRVGVGSTEKTGQGVLVDIGVGAGKTVGTGATDFFIADSFFLQSRGFGFKIGDTFKPVGLVTGAYPSDKFDIPSNNPGYAGTAYDDVFFTVLEVFDDTFSSWNFGQVDYIDSIKSLQNSQRTRFPLSLNGSLLSFQKNNNDDQSILIDLDAVLLIFVNGVIQQPKKDYFFEGGTSFSFNFSSPPGPDDDIKIYFFRGQRDVDSTLVEVDETVKPGDKLLLEKLDPNNVSAQDSRIIFTIEDSEQVETNIYRGLGIDDSLFRPITLIPQKRDLVIQEQKQFKTRDSLQSQIKPIAKVIGNFSNSEDFVFVDDAEFFKYEEDADGSNVDEIVPDCTIVEYSNPVSAFVTPTVSATGTISTVTVNTAGSGYPDGDVEISIASPKKVDNTTFGITGVGRTAVLTATASGGSIDSIGIVDPGFGYTTTNVPNVIVEIPAAETELLESCDVIIGYTGIITGVGTANGTGGHPLALKFFVDLVDATDPPLYGTLKPGYRIFVKNTTVGTGVTSVNTGDSDIVGVGTKSLDNIYEVGDFTFTPSGVGEITCNIKSDTDTVGLAATSSAGVGKFSWGLIGGFKRQVVSPISLSVDGNTVDVGLSTFPSIVRSKNVGLRRTGNLAKRVFL